MEEKCNHNKTWNNIVTESSGGKKYSCVDGLHDLESEAFLVVFISESGSFEWLRRGYNRGSYGRQGRENEEVRKQETFRDIGEREAMLKGHYEVTKVRAIKRNRNKENKNSG